MLTSRSSWWCLTVLTLIALPARARNVIEFKGRPIDLDLYLQGHPYSNPVVDLRAGKMFYKKKGQTDQLMMQSFDVGSKEKVDLSKGQVISPRDFSKRNWWGAAYSTVIRRVIIQADETSDEIMNLYALDPATGREKKLTHTSYVYGWALSHDTHRLAYVTRATKDEMSPADVRILDLASGSERIVHRDSAAQKIVWTGITWQPNEHGVLLSFNAAGDRHRRNLMYVPILEPGEPRSLTDAGKPRYIADPLNRWLNNEEYLFLADDSGLTSVYRAALHGGAPVLVGPASDNIKNAVLLNQGQRRELVTIVGDPLKSTLKRIDPRNGTVLQQETHDAQWDIADAHEDRAELTSTSLSIPFKNVELHLVEGGIELFDRLTYPEELLRRIINCDVEKVSFPTFDKLSAPGESGTLHGYLLKPKQPRPRSESRAMVEAFYGGYNSFWITAEILCQAGYYVMSPAPRGTSDFGAHFFDLAAGDWGGAETLDTFAAGKYLRDRLGLTPRQIGIFGHSRGGYDTLRALTFPGSVNGVKEEFRFGFGIAESGISDIIRAARTGNISQWYANLTGGDPAKDAAKWRDRSPETHAHRISGPVLLIHGSNDQRVPVSESRAMYAKLKRLKKPVHYLELKGQGHSYVGIDAQTKYYRAVFDFLGKLSEARTPFPTAKTPPAARPR